MPLIIAAPLAVLALINLGLWIDGRIRIERRVRTMTAAKSVLN